LLAGVSGELIDGWRLRIERSVGVALHQQLHFLRFLGALFFVGVADETAHFKRDEAVGQSLHLGGAPSRKEIARS
jgi:hypothetical protein